MSAVSLKLQLIKRENEGELLMIGRIDSSNSADAENIMLGLIDRFDTIILNMKELQYISSSGLRVLKQMYIKSRRQHKEIKIKNASKFVMETFEMTGFAGLFKFM